MLQNVSQEVKRASECQVTEIEGLLIERLVKELHLKQFYKVKSRTQHPGN